MPNVSIKKLLIIFALILIIVCLFILGLNFFTKYNIKKEVAERGEIVFLKEFENGLNPSENQELYNKTFKEAQKLVDLPIKYPKELPEGYKLFKIVLWQEEKGSEGIEIYYGKQKTNINLKEYSNFKEQNDPKNQAPSPLEKDNETVLVKETFIKPSFESWLKPKEVKLANNKSGFYWSETTADPWGFSPFKNIIYLGFSKKNQRTYYYLISSNINEEKLLNFANSIILNEVKN